MNDGVALLLVLVLLAANAFFVGAEFALISARRDRLEALLESGGPGVAKARTVLRASEQLSMMLAAAQLGITICSLALGALGEPAVAHLLERVLGPLGVPEVVLHTLGFVVALAVVTVLHIVIGEMVPKNVAIAGPERTALWLVPALVAFLRVARPIIAAMNWAARGVLAVFGVTPRDEKEVAYTPQEIAGMLSESRREGLLDASQTERLTQALSSAERTVADVLVPLERVTALPPHPTLGAVEEAVARTGFSRFPVQAPEPPDAHPRFDSHALDPGRIPIYGDGTDGGPRGADSAMTSGAGAPTRSAGTDAPDDQHAEQADQASLVELTGYVHIKDVLDLDAADPDQVVPAERVRSLPPLAVSAPVDEALAALRREGSHLARAMDAEGATVGVVALEDLVEEYVGTVRDSTHVARSGRRTP